jgi:two-component system, chemotaxis family, CheB/CheR fusion protein
LSRLRMLPVHAAAALKALVSKAKKSEGPKRAAGLSLGPEEGPVVRTDVEVVPFRLPISGERYFIVLFEESGGRKAKRVKPPPEPRVGGSLKRLRSELAATRGYLQTVVEENESASEELKSANEEIISSNEELQSTNEELEIAKEELQAANEELSTLNEELQNRNDALGLLNNDLLNLLSSVHLPIVMVGTDLRIRRFTPTAEKIMNLIPGDVGRPIGDIKPKIALPGIEDIILDVIETATTKDLAAEGQGRRYVVRVRPYRTVENKIEGAVIVFLDAALTRPPDAA